jgi:hypothetical protein
VSLLFTLTPFVLWLIDYGVNPSSWKHDCLLVAGRWLIVRGNPFATFQQSSFVSSVLPVSISFFFSFMRMSRLSAYLPLSSHLLTKWSVRLIPTIPNVWFHVDQQPNLVLANQFGFGIWQWGGGVYVVRLLETWLTNECLDCVPSDFDDLPCCLWRQQSRHRHFPPPPVLLLLGVITSPVLFRSSFSCQVAAQSLC